MQLLHITDLHVVSTATMQRLSVAANDLRSLGFDLRFDAGDEQGRELLYTTLQKRYSKSLDGIVVTGDLTGFGDDNSLSEAAEYLKSIARATLSATEDDEALLKRVFVIPGNHDVLQWALSGLSREIGSPSIFLRMFLKQNFKHESKIAIRLQRLLEELNPNGRMALGAAGVNDFSAFLESGFNLRLRSFTRPDKGAAVAPLEGLARDGQRMKLALLLISTVTLTPYLFSAGMLSEEDAASLNLALESFDSSWPDHVPVALTHQGFLPSPALFVTGKAKSRQRDIALVFEHAMASLINGYNLARMLQTRNIDLHLHGHEHVRRASCFDFELNKPGALHSFGTAASGQLSTEFGYSLFRFDTPSLVSVKQFSYNAAAANFEVSAAHRLRLGDRAPLLGRIARGELYQVFYDDGADTAMSPTDFNNACKQLFRQSQRRLLYFGVRLSSVRNDLLERLESRKSRDRDQCIARIRRGVAFLVCSAGAHYDGNGYSDQQRTDEWNKFVDKVAKAVKETREQVLTYLSIRVTDVPLAYSGLAEYSIDDEKNLSFHRALVKTNDFTPKSGSRIYFEVGEHVTSGLVQHFAGTAFRRWSDGRDVLNG